MNTKRRLSLFAFAIATAEIATVLAFVQATRAALNRLVNSANLQWSMQYGSIYGAIGGLLIGTVALLLPELRRPYLKVLCSSAIWATLTAAGFFVYIAVSLRT